MAFKRKKHPDINISGINPEDIEKFCTEIIKWKVQATKNDAIFDLFKEKPQYLTGFLAYKLIEIEHDNMRIQITMVITSVMAVLLSMVALVITYYQSIEESYFAFVAILVFIGLASSIYLISKLPGLPKLP